MNIEKYLENLNGNDRNTFYYLVDEMGLCGKNILVEPTDKGEISDGYHSFNELYHHRMILFSVICNVYKEHAWKSWKHHDGTMYDNYFIVGVSTPEGQYSYHYHKDNWDYFKVLELDFAPKWDGHQPKDIERLLSLNSLFVNN